mmetsp:Transcript_4437/g.7890  ORF Transcript_4437/g.7890 Transcript_4437/m.7890 type:complete len:85 (+) Transcript_4437:3-257(+)
MLCDEEQDLLSSLGSNSGQAVWEEIQCFRGFGCDGEGNFGNLVLFHCHYFNMPAVSPTDRPDEFDKATSSLGRHWIDSLAAVAF